MGKWFQPPGGAALYVEPSNQVLVNQDGGVSRTATLEQLVALAGATPSTGVYEDLNGSGATFKLGFRCIVADDGSVSLSVEPIFVSRGNL